MSIDPTTALAPTQPTQLQATDPTDILWDAVAFAHAQRIGTMFAASHLVPEHLRGKVADCTIALLMAKQLQESPLVVLQSIYVVSGKAGWSAQYIIARANKSGVFKGRIGWRVSGAGDALAVTAYAILAESGDEVSFEASMRMAKAEGWTKNPKYQSMPELMLRYRSATLLVRLYCPEVMLGMQTAEEVEDVVVAEVRQGPPAIRLPDPEPPRQLEAAPAPAPAAAPASNSPAQQSLADRFRAPPAAPPAPPPAPKPSADAASDALVIRVALSRAPEGRMSQAAAMSVLRADRAIQRLSSQRWDAALEHGRAAGWWGLDAEGLLCAPRAAPATPTPESDGQLSGAELAEAIASTEAMLSAERVAELRRVADWQPGHASEQVGRDYLERLIDAAERAQ